MRIQKYIIDTSYTTTLFSRYVLHNTIATNVISAGYVIIIYNPISARLVVKCFGKCAALNMKSNPLEDKKLIEEYLNSKIKDSTYLSI